jgi:hypothetical protein
MASLVCLYCDMANATINIPKTHLIMGLSLPLAVLLGYFLSEPLELGSMAVVLAVLAVLTVPLLMRWYHPLLVLAWNSAINPIILPGRAGLWMVMAAIGLCFAVLSRAVNAKAQFISVPPVTHSLLALAGVVLATAFTTGGIGIASLGGSRYGGGKYVSLLMGIAGYFALSSRRVPLQRAGLYVAAFFLSGLACLAVNLTLMVEPQLTFLRFIFADAFAIDQMAAMGKGGASFGTIRVGGFGMVAAAVYGFLLARYGIRGLLDVSKPWRVAFFAAICSLGLLGGYRGFVGLCALTVIALFCLEGLHRTRYLPILLGSLLVGALIVLPQADRLPPVAQRALSFLPGKFDPLTVESAQATIAWRVEMWKQVLPDVPKYLFHGKGYVLDPTDLYLAGETERRFASESLAGTIVAGDYHNGPLSVLIPFGIYGMLAFVWFLGAGIRTLYRYYKFGDPSLRNVNALLLCSFAVRAIYFFIFFGSIHSDLPIFAGIIGLAVSLNGAEAAVEARAEQPEVAVGLNTEYIRV